VAIATKYGYLAIANFVQGTKHFYDSTEASFPLRTEDDLSTVTNVLKCDSHDLSLSSGVNPLDGPYMLEHLLGWEFDGTTRLRDNFITFRADYMVQWFPPR
jgi:hypothetical protein